jgi:hypothetical protein
MSSLGIDPINFVVFNQTFVQSKFLSQNIISCFVTTLALGSRPRQRLAKVWAKNEAQESHFMFPGM